MKQVMFDFFNYNFSSLISIFAALMGMAYPLLLQAIQRIDEMYNSTKLAEFFQEQWFFRLFSRLLLLAIAMSILAPFLLFYYQESYDLLRIISAVHAVIVFSLTISSFVLFMYVLMTTKPNRFFDYLNEKLQKRMKPPKKWSCLNDKLQKRMKPKCFWSWLNKKLQKWMKPKCFWSWLNNIRKKDSVPLTEVFQIMKYASDKEDEKLFGNAVESIKEYLVYYRKNRCDDNTQEVGNMLEDLYKQHSKRNNHFFSNRNLITIFFFSAVERKNFTEEEYNYIWKTVDAVLQTDNDSWVYAYWTYADQYYRCTLKYDDTNDESEKRFKEQHFMIGALLTYNKKYELLGRLMSFSNVMLPSYDLVPSTFKSVISQLKNLIRKKDFPLYLTKRYLMISAPQDASSDYFILRFAYKYASLLLIRLFTVNNWNFTYSDPMELPDIPDDSTIESLDDEISMMNSLKDEISLWFEENDAIKQTIGNNSKSLDEVHKLCNSYIEKCKQSIEKLHETTQVDPKKKEYIKTHLLRALKENPLRLPIFKDAKDDNGYKEKPVHINIQYLINPAILKVGTSMNASNLPDVIVENINAKAYQAYNNSFLGQSSEMNVTIAYRDFKRVLNEIGVTQDYVAISLGVYLGNYEMLCGKDGDVEFVKEEESWSYKGCKIYSIPSAQQCIVVMKKCDMPFMKKKALDISKELKLLDDEECFYSNIDSLKDLSDETNQYIQVNRGLYLYVKDKFCYIRLNMDYNIGYATDMKRVKEAFETAFGRKQ